MHNFNMRNSQLIIKKVNLAEKIDLSHLKLKNNRTKSSITFKAKTKRVSLDLNNKLAFVSQLNTVASLQSLKSSEIFTSRHSIYSQGRKFHEQNRASTNNYQFFPKRSLLVKPHIVKNTKIELNLFGKKMMDNEEKISILAQSLYKQLNQMRNSHQQHQQKQTVCHIPRKPRVVTRAQSAPFQRKEQNIRFQPWDIGDKEDYNR